ncbi:MAG TPA: penicillin acylase family protein, partial [Polyangiaceae bacterium LLY-WYZ-14_1]|nr:penicillin acylase family protein [Polyangiaceae bacterium LLY-WYZ-14_1]
MLHSLFRRLGLAAGLAVLASGCAVAPFDSARPIADEILWDRWGVPHIYASDDTTLFFGMGWAQMENHGELILRLYGESRGRAAEYWGEDYRSGLGVPGLDSDRFVRTLGLPDRGAAAWAAQSPEARERVQAFVDGVNAWAEDNRDRLDDAVEVVLPVTGVDVLTHADRARALFLARGASRQARRILARGAEGSTAALAGSPEVQWGSSAWAVGPSRSASGNALLMGNPHVPWFDITTWHEHHLVAPGVNAYGATFVGTAGISMGFNQRLGWSATVNRHDGADLYVLELEGDGYRFGDEIRPFEHRVETLRVRRADGSVDDVSLPIRSSVHGPVLAADTERAVALRLAGIERYGRPEQSWEMARAQTLEEFEAAMRRLRIPMFNYLYADADGHIFYLFNATVPRRARGDVAFWAGAVDGTDPSLLWTEYHDYDELPRLLDPSTGWLQNANDPPWTSTLPSPLRRSDFPPYLSPSGMGA